MNKCLVCLSLVLSVCLMIFFFWLTVHEHSKLSLFDLMDYLSSFTHILAPFVLSLLYVHILYITYFVTILTFLVLFVHEDCHTCAFFKRKDKYRTELCTVLVVTFTER